MAPVAMSGEDEEEKSHAKVAVREISFNFILKRRWGFAPGCGRLQWVEGR